MHYFVFVWFQEYTGRYPRSVRPVSYTGRTRSAPVHQLKWKHHPLTGKPTSVQPGLGRRWDANLRYYCAWAFMKNVYQHLHSPSNFRSLPKLYDDHRQGAPTHTCTDFTYVLSDSQLIEPFLIRSPAAWTVQTDRPAASLIYPDHRVAQV